MGILPFYEDDEDSLPELSAAKNSGASPPKSKKVLNPGKYDRASVTAGMLASMEAVLKDLEASNARLDADKSAEPLKNTTKTSVSTSPVKASDSQVRTHQNRVRSTSGGGGCIVPVAVFLVGLLIFGGSQTDTGKMLWERLWHAVDFRFHYSYPEDRIRNDDSVSADIAQNEFGKYLVKEHRGLKNLKPGDCFSVVVSADPGVVQKQPENCDEDTAGMRITSVLLGDTAEDGEALAANQGRSFVTVNSSEADSLGFIHEVLPTPGCHIYWTEEGRTHASARVYECKTISNSEKMKVGEFYPGPNCREGEELTLYGEKVCFRFLSDEEISQMSS